MLELFLVGQAKHNWVTGFSGNIDGDGVLLGVDGLIDEMIKQILSLEHLNFGGSTLNLIYRYSTLFRPLA